MPPGIHNGFGRINLSGRHSLHRPHPTMAFAKHEPGQPIPGGGGTGTHSVPLAPASEALAQGLALVHRADPAAALAIVARYHALVGGSSAGALAGTAAAAIPAHLRVVNDFVPAALREQLALPVFARVPDGTIQRRVDPSDEFQTIPSTNPADLVEISGLWAGRYAVSNAEVLAWMYDIGKTDERNLKGRFAGVTQPAVVVSWDDATAYCRWLTGKLRGAGVAITIRLPFEMEHEYLQRANRSGEAIAGTASGQVDPSQAHYGKSLDTNASLPVDAAEIPPLHFGEAVLHQLAGNTFEWTGTVWKSGSSARVGRGGSWLNGAGGLRASVRLGNLHDGRFSDLGFRVMALEDSKP